MHCTLTNSYHCIPVNCSSQPCSVLTSPLSSHLFLLLPPPLLYDSFPNFQYAFIHPNSWSSQWEGLLYLASLRKIITSKKGHLSYLGPTLKVAILSESILMNLNELFPLRRSISTLYLDFCKMHAPQISLFKL